MFYNFHKLFERIGSTTDIERFFLRSLLLGILVWFCYSLTNAKDLGTAVTLDAPNPVLVEINHIELADFLILSTNRKNLIIDLREDKQYQQGHIPGAINIPYNLFRFSLSNEYVMKIKEASNIIFYDVTELNDVANDFIKSLADIEIRNISIYTAGWKQWKSCLLPIAKSVDDEDENKLLYNSK